MLRDEKQYSRFDHLVGAACCCHCLAAVVMVVAGKSV